MTITSPHNAKLKEVRRLLGRRRERARTGLFVAEGEDLVAAADAAGWEPVHRLAAAGSGLAGEEVEPQLLAEVSSLGSGTRTLATYRARSAAPAGPLCLALWGVRDPGNVGTVLRSAQAFGAATVVLGPHCADPFGPKAVRASMGAVFHVPVARARTVGDLPGTRVALAGGEGEPLRGDGLRAADGQPLGAAGVRGPGGPGTPAVSLIIGAEREGLPADVLAACDRVVHIPIRSESLNAAMAATVALYEVTR